MGACANVDLALVVLGLVVTPLGIFGLIGRGSGVEGGPSLVVCRGHSSGSFCPLLWVVAHGLSPWVLWALCSWASLYSPRPRLMVGLSSVVGRALVGPFGLFPNNH